VLGPTPEQWEVQVLAKGRDETPRAVRLRFSAALSWPADAH
jgi:hypothetical protein